MSDISDIHMFVLKYLSKIEIKFVFSFCRLSIYSTVLMLGRNLQLLMNLRTDTVSVIMYSHSCCIETDGSGMYSSKGSLEFQNSKINLENVMQK